MGKKSRKKRDRRAPYRELMSRLIAEAIVARDNWRVTLRKHLGKTGSEK